MREITFAHAPAEELAKNAISAAKWAKHTVEAAWMDDRTSDGTQVMAWCAFDAAAELCRMTAHLLGCLNPAEEDDPRDPEERTTPLERELWHTYTQMANIAARHHHEQKHLK